MTEATFKGHERTSEQDDMLDEIEHELDYDLDKYSE
ncbi:hypothetical protein A2U01_0045644, partial [Trifolium medium]|nr:hypothetical protein [Trifolium medium]